MSETHKIDIDTIADAIAEKVQVNYLQDYNQHVTTVPTSAEFLDFCKSNKEKLQLSDKDMEFLNSSDGPRVYILLRQAYNLRMHSNTTVYNLWARVNFLKDQIQLIEEQKVKEQKTIKDLQEELSQAQNKVQIALELLDREKIKVKRAEDTTEIYRRDSVKAYEQLSKVKSENSTIVNKYGQIRQRCDQLQSTLFLRETTLDATNKDVLDLKKKISELDKQIAERNQELIKAKARIESIQQQQMQDKDALIKQQKTYDQLISQHKNVAKVSEELREDLSEARRHLGVALAENSELQRYRRIAQELKLDTHNDAIMREVASARTPIGPFSRRV